METINEIRRENARKLCDACGTQAEFARRLGVRRQQASHLVGSNPVKGIGDDQARKIESKFGKEIGWLDHLHREPDDAAEASASKGRDDGGVDIAPLPTTTMPSSGGARHLLSIRLSRDWLQAMAGTADASSLAVVAARGNAMMPTISDGAWLLVDRRETTVRADGVYVLEHGEEMPVRRVSRTFPRGFTVACDDGRYSAREVLSVADIRAVGRVLMAWNPARV